MGQAKEKVRYEELVKSVAEKVAIYIEENDIKGSCHFVTYFYKYYLLKYHNINVSSHRGVIMVNNSFGHHSWNSFNGKLIDLTIHKQHVINYNCIILDQIFIDNGLNATLFSHKKLPKAYLENIDTLSKVEFDLKSKQILTEEEENKLNEIQSYLVMDTPLYKFNEYNYSTITELEEFLFDSENDYERSLFFKLFDIKDL